MDLRILNDASNGIIIFFVIFVSSLLLEMICLDISAKIYH